MFKLRNYFRYTVFPFVLLVLMNAAPMAQSQPKTNLRSAADARGPLQERVYLKTDKDNYLAGEIIWFKTYIFNTFNHQLLDVSKVIYVEILDPQNKPVLQGKIAVEKGTGSGSFMIPYTLPTSGYKMRAYTNWMKNFSPENYGGRFFTIVNTTQPVKAFQMANDQQAFSASFFPEGGNLVTDVQSRVAFKFTDRNGKGVRARGYITGSTNDTVVSFATSKFGMGHFTFTPRENTEYNAFIRFDDGSTLQKTLPKAQIGGYVMSVTEVANNQIEVSITTNERNNIRSARVIARQGGRKSFESTREFVNRQAIFQIDRNALPEGICAIAVVDNAGKPLAERLYFQRPSQTMDITLGEEMKSYPKRTPVTLDIKTSGVSQKAIPANLHVSVYRLNGLQQRDEQNILGDTWLTSQLQEPVESPSYYFNQDDENMAETINNLMLTQGRGKSGQHNTSSQTIAAYKYVPEFVGHFITGRVTNVHTQRPEAGLTVFLSVPGKRLQVRPGITDEEGLVHFEMEDLFGTNELVMQTATAMAGQYRFEIFSPFSEEYSAKQIPELQVIDNLKDELNEAHFDMQVQNGYYNDKLNQFFAPAKDTLPFYYKPTTTYLLDDFKRFTTMEEVLREYVPEINVRKNATGFRLFAANIPAFRLKSMQTTPPFDKTPFMLLDGIPVFDTDKMMAYDPLKVRKAEVVAEGYSFGTVDMEGIMSLTTYKGNLEGFNLREGDLLLDYEGLQEKRIFFSPEYQTNEQRIQRLPDYRNLLSWEPDVRTDTTGKASVKFTTGDLPGTYLISIEGIANDGSIGAKYLTFEVK